MSRPVNREKHESKRTAIVRAASSQFAIHGYERSTTAAICREADISSGTFFHYFPTKLDVLVAVLEAGCDDLRLQLAQIEQDAAGLEAILRYATVVEAELGEDSYPTFVAGLAGVESHTRVAAALTTEAELTAQFLVRHAEAGQRIDDIRRDAPADQLATWASWLIDGAAQSAAVRRTQPGTNVRDCLRAILEAPQR